MSETWENYYDFYLDGKPAAAPRAKFRADDAPGSSQGWVTRNATAEVRDGALRLKGDNPGKAPFIARSGFQLKTPFTVRLSLRAETGKRLGIAWRTKDQDDFPQGQVAHFDAASSDDWQTLEAAVTGESPVIHVRFLLPPGDTAIRSIQFLDNKGATLQSWDFSLE